MSMSHVYGTLTCALVYTPSKPCRGGLLIVRSNRLVRLSRRADTSQRPKYSQLCAVVGLSCMGSATEALSPKVRGAQCWRRTAEAAMRAPQVTTRMAVGVCAAMEATQAFAIELLVEGGVSQLERSRAGMDTPPLAPLDACDLRPRGETSTVISSKAPSTRWV